MQVPVDDAIVMNEAIDGLVVGTSHDPTRIDKGRQLAPVEAVAAEGHADGRRAIAIVLTLFAPVDWHESDHHLIVERVHVGGEHVDVGILVLSAARLWVVARD